MRDNIYIEGMEIEAYHGVLEKEKSDGQIFYIDARLYFDMSAMGVSDDLGLTVDYSKVCTVIKETFIKQKYDLIETTAECVAREVLCNFDMIDEVDITIHKPSAPVAEKIRDVSVNITRRWKTVYLGIGSNIGDKQGYVNMALCKLKESALIKDVVCSKLITTKPYGPVAQDDFLNGAVGIKTLMSPPELLNYLHVIESEAKRVREIHWGPRTLDLDILLYEDVVMSTDDLVIPHPDMHNRQFVLEPLMELAPNYVNPQTGQTIKEMFELLN